MAASVLIVIGLGTFIALQSNAPATQQAFQLPTKFAQAMADRHDTCQNVADHQMPGHAKDDLRLLSKDLRAELGFPALVTTLGEGWNFDGARICNIGEIATAHLRFTRDRQSLSIFSLPGKAIYATQDGTEYQQTVGNHQIAGFVRGTTMYCVVGTSAKGDLTLKQMKAISDQLEKRLRDGQTARIISPFDPAALASR